MRKRTERRAALRQAEKLARDRARLAAFEPGGAPDRPIAVRSAAVIEVRALAEPCLRCNASDQRLIEHAAVETGGERLRVVDTACAVCGTQRRRYFKIGEPLSN
jgi:hypothetical protein